MRLRLRVSLLHPSGASSHRHGRLAEGFTRRFQPRGHVLPALSLGHFRAFMERSIGPMQKTVHRLESADPRRSATLRAEFETLATPYFTDNQVHQHYLLTRAQAR